MRIQTDRRSLEIDFEDAREVQLEALGRELRPLRVRVAKAFAAAEAAGRHFLHGFAQMEGLAQKLGYGREEARRYRMVGRAMDVVPELEARLLEGGISFESAAVLGDLTRYDELRDELAPGAEANEDHEQRRLAWLDDASQMSPRQLRRVAKRRIAEVRSQRPIVMLTLAVTPETEVDLDRAKVIASRRQMMGLTRGETVAVVLTHYLDRFDPLRKGSREGEKEPAVRGTGTRASQEAGPDQVDSEKHTRHISARVRQKVRHRAGDCCEYPGCSNDHFLQFAHIVAHRSGGAQAARNLLLLCTRHHHMLDAGIIRFRKWGADGPEFETMDGESIPAGKAEEEYG